MSYIMSYNLEMSKYKAFEQSSIPYKIEMTDRFVKYLMEIAESRPFLDEAFSTPLKLTLLRQAEIKAITYSNQIEGNTLTEKQVTALLDKKHTSKKITSEEKEILNYRNALNLAERIVEDKRPPSKQDFFDLQRLITDGLIDKHQSGKARTIAVSIVNETTKTIIDECPEPHLLTGLLNDLWQWIQDTDSSNPYARAFAFHFIAVAIHPFVDGNGRTVRLFQQVLLQKSGETFAQYIPTESAIMKHRKQYYLSIRESKAMNSLSPMMEFLAKCYAESAKEVVKSAKTLFEQTKERDSERRHKTIINVARKIKLFKIGELEKKLPEINRKTLMRDLKSLVGSKKLTKTGELKGTQYQLSKATKSKSISAKKRK